MKARLFVVDKESRMTAMTSKEVSIKVPEPEGTQWNKTITDIISDLLQVKIGDYIFLWESGTENIYGVFRAISNAYYDSNAKNGELFKIKFDIAYNFENPISEYSLINDPYMKNKLWNIIGKKVAGKSRGTTPLSPEETQFLIQALIDKNPLYSFNKDFTIFKPLKPELSFDFKTEYSSQIPQKLSAYKYEPIKVRTKNEVHYEKALEGILNILIKEKKINALKELGVPVNNIHWYANYLPYGLERSEIDYMIMESEDGTNVNRIDVIELMRSVIDVDHIRRCLQYSRWVADSISNGKNIVRPMIICGIKSLTAKNGVKSKEVQDAINAFPEKYGFSKLDIYTYELTEKGISFNLIK